MDDGRLNFERLPPSPLSLRLRYRPSSRVPPWRPIVMKRNLPRASARGDARGLNSRATPPITATYDQSSRLDFESFEPRRVSGFFARTAPLPPRCTPLLRTLAPAFVGHPPSTWSAVEITLARGGTYARIVSIAHSLGARCEVTGANKRREERANRVGRGEKRGRATHVTRRDATRSLPVLNPLL